VALFVIHIVREMNLCFRKVLLAGSPPGLARETLVAAARASAGHAAAVTGIQPGNGFCDVRDP
jgi:hypothetical protein